MHGTVLVTPRSVTKSGHPSLHMLSDAGYEVKFCAPGKMPSENELLLLLPGCVGYLAGVEKITAKALDAADALKVISRNGVGIDNIDLQAAKRKGIAICRAEGTNARGVAELAMAHILSLLRAIPFSDKTIKGGFWERRMGVEAEGRTLGLIGCGRIGKLVAKFAMGMNMKVRAFDTYQDASFKPEGDFAYASFNEVMKSSDVISLHCPPSQGKPLLDETAFERMKKGVFIVNTARADLIDKAALSKYLENGKVAGAALDVFENEPPKPDAIIASDKVVATPHAGGFTAESVERAMDAAVGNLIEKLKER